MSLAFGISTNGSALVYFWVAIIVIAISLIFMALVDRYNHFYCFNMRGYAKVKKVKMLKFRQIIDLLKDIWPAPSIMVFWILTVMSVHTGITSLVVSEEEGSGEWNGKNIIQENTKLGNSF